MVFFEGVTGGQEEDCLYKHKSQIYPTESTLGFDFDAMADPGDGSRDTHVAVKFVVNIMNFDQQSIRIDLAGELREIQIGRRQPCRSMNQIDTSPANGGDRHANSERCYGQVQEAADRRSIAGS